MKRDWQKDMEYLNRRKVKASNTDYVYLLHVAEHWLGQYADASNEVCFWKGEHSAEKERADRAIQERKQFNQVYEMLLKKFKESESREKNLREAIESVRQIFENEWTYELGVGEVVDEILGKFDSLYSKEETK